LSAKNGGDEMPAVEAGWQASTDPAIGKTFYYNEQGDSS